MVRPPGNGQPKRAHEAHLRETLHLAQGLLSEALGAAVGLERITSFRGATSRATVLRCRVRSTAGGSLVPERVIVKRFRQEGGGPYDATQTTRVSPRGRLLSEWSGLRFVHASSGALGFGPAPLAGNAARGLVVMEDLGEGECLADVLQANDPAAAEAALAAYAGTLGRLHGATAGRRAEHERIRSGLAGASGVEPGSVAGAYRADILPALRRTVRLLDVRPSLSCDTELDAVAALIESPGAFDAFSVSDTCPDNHRYVRADSASAASAPGRLGGGPWTGFVRFFDLEFSTFRHALIDAAYLWMPFPTCWCVNRLPDGLPERLTRVYRDVLARTCAPAADDDRFGRALAAGCIYWLAQTFAWNLERALDEDSRWGTSTVRQRHPLRAQNVADVCARYGHFPAVGALAGELASRLRERWGTDGEMPLYPAFRAAV
jgi:hypothetical protein